MTTTLNRQQRRQAEQMQRRQPPARRRDRGAINTMDMVRAKVARLTAAEVASILQPVEAGFDALRRGVASELHWHCLAEMVTMAVSIEASGIVTGLSEPFAAARAALLAVRERVTQQVPPTWGSSTELQADELAAIGEAVSLHRFQLAQLSGGELQSLFRALVRATAR